MAEEIPTLLPNSKLFDLEGRRLVLGNPAFALVFFWCVSAVPTSMSQFHFCFDVHCTPMRQPMCHTLLFIFDVKL